MKGEEGKVCVCVYIYIYISEVSFQGGMLFCCQFSNGVFHEAVEIFSAAKKKWLSIN